MNNTTTKVRFCPSPTGLMHLGNARTALFNALYAIREQGVFLLRIEDTDESRSHYQYTQALMRDLHWLGIPWQEGPEVGGPHEPYWQSERQAIYDRCYQELISKGLAYPCFCSEEKLKLDRKIQLSAGQPPRYPGTCRELTESQCEAKFAAGERATLRFAMPRGQMIEFVDAVKGPQRFSSDDIGDFIIRRADGTASFMFCNAVDDALMGVTDVLRGEDHLTNTPRQLMILDSLGFHQPTYGHFALIMGSDGKPLSKRNGSRSIEDLRELGFFAEAVVNYLGRLGHRYEVQESLVVKELGGAFTIDHLSKGAAKFDEDQLKYWQKQAVANASVEQLEGWMKHQLTEHVLPEKQRAFVDLIRPNVLFPKDAVFWAKQFFVDELAYDEHEMGILSDAGPEFFKTALQAISATGLDYKKLCEQVKDTCSVKGKQLFLPLRVALTGELHGPELAGVMNLLGLEEVRHRFEVVLEKLTGYYKPEE